MRYKRRLPLHFWPLTRGKLLGKCLLVECGPDTGKFGKCQGRMRGLILLFLSRYGNNFCILVAECCNSGGFDLGTKRPKGAVGAQVKFKSHQQGGSISDRLSDGTVGEQEGGTVGEEGKYASHNTTRGFFF